MYVFVADSAEQMRKETIDFLENEIRLVQYAIRGLTLCSARKQARAQLRALQLTLARFKSAKLVPLNPENANFHQERQSAFPRIQLVKKPATIREHVVAEEVCSAP